MLNTLQTSDFEMHSRNQVLNFEFLRDYMKRNDYLEHPLLKMEHNIRLRSKINQILKMEHNIRLKLSRLLFSKNQLDPIHIKPP